MKKNVSIIFIIFTTVFISCQDELLNEPTLAEEISSITTQNVADEFKKASDSLINLRKEDFFPFEYKDFINEEGNINEPDYETGDGYYFTSKKGGTTISCNFQNSVKTTKHINQYFWSGVPYTSGQMKTSLIGYETDDAKVLYVRNGTKTELYTYSKKNETLKSLPAYKIGIDYGVNIKILKKNILIIETWDFVRAGQYHAYIIVDIISGEYYNFPIKGLSSMAEYEPHFK